MEIFKYLSNEMKTTVVFDNVNKKFGRAFIKLFVSINDGKKCATKKNSFLNV